MIVRYIICYRLSSNIMRAHCVGKVQYMQLGSIMIMGSYCVFLGNIMIMGAYCVGKVHNMLPR